MTAKTHGRSGRPWRDLRLQVLKEEPYCQVRSSKKCTGISTTVDHIVPLSVRPDLAHVRSNLRGACAACNYAGGARITNARRNGYRPPPPRMPSVQDMPCSWPGAGLPCNVACGGSLAPHACRMPRPGAS